jgi:hypothetical protein
LKVGFEQSKFLQEYENLALVVSAALGGKSKGGSSGKPAETAEEAVAQFASVFGTGAVTNGRR